MASGQGEDVAQAGGGLGLAYGPAGDERVFGERGFHVHGKAGVGLAGQHVGHHVGTQTVGVDFDRRSVFGQLGREIGQARDQGRFAAGDDQAVDPAGVGAHEPAHRALVQGRHGAGSPGQAGVVAMGTA